MPVDLRLPLVLTLVLGALAALSLHLGARSTPPAKAWRALTAGGTIRPR